jgi:hypothetical protein
VDQQTALLALLLPLKQRYSEADAKHSFRKCVSVMFLGAPRDDEEMKAIVNKLPAGKSVPGQPWQARAQQRLLCSRIRPHFRDKPMRVRTSLLFRFTSPRARARWSGCLPRWRRATRSASTPRATRACC